MKKRTLWLGLVLLACLFSEGCCWCNRPFLIRRWWWGGCCPNSCAAPACSSCCDGGVIMDHYPGNVIPAPSGPTMPGATPLTRAQFPNK
jgi:hypothetical protein